MPFLYRVLFCNSARELPYSMIILNHRNVDQLWKLRFHRTGNLGRYNELRPPALIPYRNLLVQIVRVDGPMVSARARATYAPQIWHPKAAKENLAAYYGHHISGHQPGASPCSRHHPHIINP